MCVERQGIKQSRVKNTWQKERKGVEKRLLVLAHLFSSICDTGVQC